MQRTTAAIVLLTAAVAATWHYRDALRQHLAASPPPPVAETIVVYSWRDAQGIMHFSESPMRGARRKLVSTDRITPLPALPASAKPASDGQPIRDTHPDSPSNAGDLRQKVLERAVESS